MPACAQNKQQHDNTDNRIAEKRRHGRMVGSRMDNKSPDQKQRQWNIGERGDALQPEMFSAFFAEPRPRTRDRGVRISLMTKLQDTYTQAPMPNR